MLRREPRAQPIAEVITREPAPVAKEHIYSELIAQRPALLDEKLKLHERIIDEFNLVSLKSFRARTWFARFVPISANMSGRSGFPSIRESCKPSRRKSSTR